MDVDVSPQCMDLLDGAVTWTGCNYRTRLKSHLPQQCMILPGGFVAQAWESLQHSQPQMGPHIARRSGYCLPHLDVGLDLSVLLDLHAPCVSVCSPHWE